MSLNTSKGILITGGTGSFGKAFLGEVLNRFPNIPRIVIYSRDEYKQWELSNIFPASKFPQLRFFLGDIRDQKRLSIALNKIDTVIHAAALKQVPAAEYNPIEFIKTNVLGTENLVQACLANNVERVLALSTDKAASPINLYGATKLCADKLIVAANNITGERNLKFSVVRYGNVLGSRGSVIPLFLDQAKQGNLCITDKRMTRFNITIKEAVNFVISILDVTLGGEIFVPKLFSYKITDVAEAIGPTCKHEIVGIRSGEKIHEEMITFADSINTIDLGDKYAILPSDGELLKKYNKKRIDYKNVPNAFHYDSYNNSQYLTIEQIRELIKENLFPEFVPI